MVLSVLKLRRSWANRDKLLILPITKGLGKNKCPGLQDPPAGHPPPHTSQDRDSQTGVLIGKRAKYQPAGSSSSQTLGEADSNVRWQ